jgi:hypothetical protein
MTCEWLPRSGETQCRNEATIPQRHASDRPRGGCEAWSTDRLPTYPQDYEPDISHFCEEHARLGLFSMVDEFRAWTLRQLSSINDKVQAILDTAFALGYLPAEETERLTELVARHEALIYEARQLIHRLERQEARHG